jgi:hypothetical protein
VAGRKSDDAYAKEAIFKLIEVLRVFRAGTFETTYVEQGAQVDGLLDDAEAIAAKIDAPLRKKVTTVVAKGEPS